MARYLRKMVSSYLKLSSLFLIVFSKGKNILGSALHSEYSQVNDFLASISDISASIMEIIELVI